MARDLVPRFLARSSSARVGVAGRPKKARAHGVLTLPAFPALAALARALREGDGEGTVCRCPFPHSFCFPRVTSGCCRQAPGCDVVAGGRTAARDTCGMASWHDEPDLLPHLDRSGKAPWLKKADGRSPMLGMITAELCLALHGIASRR
eukprot:358066-Chlamydomonas_euryale.AAC.9